MQTHKKDIVWPEAGVVKKGAGARDETEGVGRGGGEEEKTFLLLSSLNSPASLSGVSLTSTFSSCFHCRS